MKNIYGHSNPENWIWGLFYYNKNDKRLLPPKRNSWMGWTVNFANPKSVIVFILILSIFYLVIYFLKLRHM